MSEREKPAETGGLPGESMAWREGGTSAGAPRRAPRLGPRAESARAMPWGGGMAAAVPGMVPGTSREPVQEAEQGPTGSGPSPGAEPAAGARRLLELPFSDLIISRQGPFYAKGLPGMGGALFDLTRLGPAVARECQDLAAELDGEGVGVGRAAQRHARHGVAFRVSREEDILLGPTWFLRRVPSSVPSLEELDVRPAFAREWLMRPEMAGGLCLMAGAQASGKTTLASAAVAWRLARFGGHCVTFEAPAEMPLAGRHGPHGHCWQTEIASEDELPGRLVRAHMFAGPDIIYIGEIKTPTAAAEALRVSLGSPGQLVIATIHGTDVASALRRLLDWGAGIEGTCAAENLAMALSTVLLLELRGDPSGRRWQEVPECLLLPRGPAALNDTARAQLREGNLAGLAETMARMRVKLERAGLRGLR